MAAAYGVAKSRGGTTGSVAGLDAEQQHNAALIVQVGKNLGMSSRDIAIAIMTAMDESSLHNLHSGDRDSQGLFQQRPSQGWGTVAQVTDPNYASTTFYNHLKGVGNRDNMDPWAAAQAVQNSGFPDGSNYRQFWNTGSNGFQVGAVDIASYFGSGGVPAAGYKQKPFVPTTGPGAPGTATIEPGFPGEDIINSATSGIGTSVSGIVGTITSWQSAVEAIGSFFGAILWIFNVDHFMKFLLYIFGTLAVLAGLGLISFGAGHDEGESA